MCKFINLCVAIFLFSGCQIKTDEAEAKLEVDHYLDYCVLQATKMLDIIPNNDSLPRSIGINDSVWHLRTYRDWTSGFWPGILWYLYEYTNDEKWRIEADGFSRKLTPLAYETADNHDLGFMVYCSFGNGYRLTQSLEYKEIILKTANNLTTLFNPRIGTILSWPWMMRRNGHHNSIIDNMMNLELLYWASKNGGADSLYQIAISHAETTMQNHFRDDYSAYHVVLYDSVSGQKIKGMTHQGYSDRSMWSRGQAWAIYGYTMTYRETGDPKFLEFAKKVTDVYLNRLPDDMIPFWDFDAPGIPNEPKDASAAAITASALLELSELVLEKGLARLYFSAAEKMLEELSSKYLSKDKNSAFLLHSTGHYPNGGEVDASIIYADYYYIEALLRLKRLNSFN